MSAHGAAMLVRRDVLLELGGFDETFFIEWEDLDLCWRAWLRGHRSVYVPAASVRHRVGAATTAADLTPRLASSHHNLMRFALKCLPARAAARVLAGELLRLPAHPRLIAPALLAVLRRAAGDPPPAPRDRPDRRPTSTGSWRGCPNEQARALVVSNDHVGTAMAGPGIRAHRFAVELARDFDVTLVVPFETDLVEERVEIVHDNPWDPARMSSARPRLRRRRRAATARADDARCSPAADADDLRPLRAADARAAGAGRTGGRRRPSAA